MRSLTLCLFALVAVAGVLADSNETQPTLSVQGSAEVSVPPDQANVVFTTSVTEDSARNARQNAANVTNTVLAALGEIEGLNVTEDVRTVTITVSPKTETDKESGRERIVGYTFEQQINVLISNITGDMLSDVLDTIVISGGDDVTIDSFSLSASTDLISQATNNARQAAVEDAQAIAELLSAAAGVVLGRPIQIQDTNAAPRTADFQPAAGEAARLVSTPVPTGELTISASVSMVFEIEY